jgi:hypothetical protein
MMTVGALTKSGSEPDIYIISNKTGWNQVVFQSRTNLDHPVALSLPGAGCDFILEYGYCARYSP